MKNIVPVYQFNSENILQRLADEKSKQFALNIAMILSSVRPIQAYMWAGDVVKHRENEKHILRHAITFLKKAYELESSISPYGERSTLYKLLSLYLQYGRSYSSDLDALVEMLFYADKISDQQILLEYKAKIFGAFCLFEPFSQLLSEQNDSDFMAGLIKIFIGELNAVGSRNKSTTIIDQAMRLTDLYTGLTGTSFPTDSYYNIFPKKKIGKFTPGGLVGKSTTGGPTGDLVIQLVSHHKLGLERSPEILFGELKESSNLSFVFATCVSLAKLGFSIKELITFATNSSVLSTSLKHQYTLLTYLYGYSGKTKSDTKRMSFYKKLISIDPDNATQYIERYNTIGFLKGMRLLKSNNFSKANLIEESLLDSEEKQLLRIFIDFAKSSNKQMARRQLLLVISCADFHIPHEVFHISIPIFIILFPADHPVIIEMKNRARHLTQNIDDLGVSFTKRNEQQVVVDNSDLSSMDGLWNGPHIPKAINKNALNVTKSGWKE